MLYAVVSEKYSSLLALGGILFAFVATVVATVKLESHLPKDAGREFAHDGKLHDAREALSSLRRMHFG